MMVRVCGNAEQERAARACVVLGAGCSPFSSVVAHGRLRVLFFSEPGVEVGG